MKFSEFQKKLTKEYKKYFINSQLDISIFHCLGQMITIDCYLAKDETEEAYKIMRNDMFDISFSIDVDDNFNVEKDNLSDSMTLKIVNNTYKIKPVFNNYFAYDIIKVSARKTTGDVEKIINYISKYFKKLHDSLIISIDNDYIHKEYTALLNEKFIK